MSDPSEGASRSHGHSHSHSPDNGHSHSHGNGHSHESDDAPHGAREPLEAKAGEGKLLFFDCFSGVAGDMTIAALVDLGVPFEIVVDAAKQLPVDGYSLEMRRRVRSGIVAAKLEVAVTGTQPHRTYGEIDAMLVDAPLAPLVKDLSRAVFRRLGEAEAHAHRMPLRDVHFHEVGAVDAIIDIVGSAAALVYLGADVVVSPLPMGRGFVRAAHGVLPLPAPATVNCLVGAPTYAVDLEVELVTPTGAAIVATAATAYACWPTMRPLRVGYGSGTRELPDRPNLLRVVLGEPMAVASARQETHVVVEANVDDMTGELAAHVMQALRGAGAVDAWATPIIMKKGRPALSIAALAPRSHEQIVADALLRESTSIGVRTRLMSRVVRPRSIDNVETKFGPIPVKVSRGDFGPAQAKPEFDACAAAAAEHRVPVREVVAEALVVWRSQTSDPPS